MSALDDFQLFFEEVKIPKYMKKRPVKAVMVSQLKYPQVTTKRN